MENMYPDICGVSYIGAPRDRTAVFLTRRAEALLPCLEHARGCLVFAEEGIEPPPALRDRHTFVFSPDPAAAYNAFAAAFREKEDAYLASFGSDLRGGAQVGRNAVIGEGTSVSPFCVIGNDAVIGRNCVIGPGCVIDHARIGDGCVLGAHTVLGSDGFCLTRDGSGANVPVVALGKVRLENGARLLERCAVSRGLADDTVIGENACLDADVRVSHDARVGKRARLAAGTVLGGFAVIGEDVFIGLNAAVRNRITVGDGALVGMGAVVIRDVPAGQRVAGNPAKALD